MNGSAAVNASPVYGAKGVAGINNTPGGLYEAINWIDTAGVFWIFGGVPIVGASGSSDLWKYEPLTNMWTWVKGPGVYEQVGVYGVKGVPAPSNNPGGRGWGSIAWTDKNNDLWLFGGDGFDINGNPDILNDLWRYNIASNQWTWMGGSEQRYAIGNYGSLRQFSDTGLPSPRMETNSGWVDDNNNLWFFGGNGSVPVGGGNFEQLDFNDMWCYNVANNQWAWMSGSMNGTNNGSYGSKGVESPSNLPSPRFTYTQWKDEAGYFYIWGGSCNNGNLSDIWRYNTNSNNWTWIAGDASPNSYGNYSRHCEENGEVEPFSRFENRTAPSLTGAHIFPAFGGQIATPDGGGVINDLWYFNTQTNEWTWISGDSTRNSGGNFGALGVSAASNMPPARSGNCTWVDRDNVVWIFGGQYPTNVNNALNDLWKFVPAKSCKTCVYCDSSLAINNLHDIESDNFQLFPNPNNGAFTLTFPDAENRSIEITDALGKIITCYQNNSSVKEVALSGLSSGVYFARTKHLGRLEILKFVVLK